MPDASSPQVTVLMPVRNGADHVRAAIESILAQTFTDFEFLIIDDGSTDATPDILRGLRDPRIRIVTHPVNLGLVPTLNEGLGLARGQWIARQDHDDLSHPDRLRRQVDYLRAHSDCALLGTEAFAMIGHEARAYRMLRPTTAESIRWYLCFDNAFIHSSVMFRRQLVIEEFEGYPKSLHSEDYALWSRIAERHATANLAEPLLTYREHAASVTGSMSEAAAAAFDAATGDVRARNLQSLFGDGARREDAVILSTYRRGLSVATASDYLRIFDRLVSAQPRESRDAAGLRRIQAVQLAELAYRLLPVSRGKSIALYWRALTLHPALAGHLPWARAIALLVFGEWARAIYLACFGPRRPVTP